VGWGVKQVDKWPSQNKAVCQKKQIITLQIVHTAKKTEWQPFFGKPPFTSMKAIKSVRILKNLLSDKFINFKLYALSDFLIL